jgi:hypothetical protein
MAWEISGINTARTSDITLLSVRPQHLYTPYTHNIWYHLTICPVTTPIHTIYQQYLISPYCLSGHNNYTHHIPTISDITLLSVRSQQLYTPSIDWYKRFQFGNSRLHIWWWRSVIQNCFEELTGNISQYVTTTSFWYSNLLQATEYRVLWWTTVCTKNSIQYYNCPSVNI